jgi:DNA (cytosine-5)-methyltransferase 1
MAKRATTLSIFSGIGGLDLGAASAGCRIELSTDVDAEALTLLSRACGSPVLAGDIDDLLHEGLRTRWGSTRPQLLIGGPPCTPFSHAGFWIDRKRESRDPAASLLASYLACLREFEPDAFVLENVPGLAFATHKRWLDQIVTGASRLGYSITTEVLRASAFGVPQVRRRLFVAGIRGRKPVDLSRWPAFPIRSAAWAIGDLAGRPCEEPDEVIGERYRDLLPIIQPGGNYLQLTAERGCSEPQFGYRRRYWSFLLKLDPAKPSPTLPAQRITYNGPFHWENRHLRLREMARLQGFPDWYPLSPTLVHARRHLGNAVPPLLAAAVVWRVLQALGLSSDKDLPLPLEVARRPDASSRDVLDAFPRIAGAGLADS